MKNRSLLCWNGSKKNLEEIPYNNVLDLKLLYGVDSQISKISLNTENFLNDLSFNHALLWGVRGSGKSSIVRGVVSEFASKYDNFITLEINSEDFNEVQNGYALIKNDQFY